MHLGCREADASPRDRARRTPPTSVELCLHLQLVGASGRIAATGGMHTPSRIAAMGGMRTTAATGGVYISLAEAELHPQQHPGAHCQLAEEVMTPLRSTTMMPTQVATGD